MTGRHNVGVNLYLVKSLTIQVDIATNIGYERTLAKHKHTVLPAIFTIHTHKDSRTCLSEPRGVGFN